MKGAQQLTIVGNPSSATVELHRGSLLTFGERDVDVEIEVCRGELWVTAEGSFEDRILKAGDLGAFRGRHVVAEALSDTRLCLNK